MRTRIWQEPGGTVKITTVPDDASADHAFATLLADGHVHPDATFVDAAGPAGLIPDSRRFRACWRLINGIVKPDVPLAKAQRLDEIRTKRNGFLDDSDKDYLRAQDQGDAVALAALKTYRQALRDLPQSITLPNNLTTLGNYEPPWPVKP